VVTRQLWIRRRSGKVRRLQTDVLTTEPRRQPYLVKNNSSDLACRIVDHTHNISTGANHLLLGKTIINR